MINYFKLFILLFSLILLGFGCATPEEETDDAATTETSTVVNTTSNTHNAMLESLGVNIDLGSREDVNGNELEADYNPLGYKQGTLFKLTEIYGAGIDVNEKSNVLFQDGKSNDGINDYSVLFQEEGTDWDNGFAKKSIAADVDGDGLDEIVLAVYYQTSNEIAIRIVDYNDNILGEKKRFTHYGTLSEDLVGATGGGQDWEDAFTRQDMLRGDLDGDGKHEIILLVGAYMYVLDDINNGFKLLQYLHFLEEEGEDTYLRGDTADFDLDGRDEIIVAEGRGFAQRTAVYTIFDDLVNDPTMINPLDREAVLSIGTSSTTILRVADVAAGDFDGDGLPEVAFAGKRYEDETPIYTIVLDTKMDEYSKPEFYFLPTTISDDNEPGYHFQGIVAGDLDGDRKDEIITWQDVYILNNGTLQLQATWGDDALGTTLDQLPSLDIIAVGDVTGDQKDDIVYLTRDNTAIHIHSIATDGTLAKTSIAVGAIPTNPTICLPNVDDDSAVLKYINHELLFTDPVIVAVLASPPNWSGINDNGLGGTDFGSVDEYSNVAEKSYGFSTSLSLGTSFEAPFGLGKAELTTTAENSLNWGTSQTQTISETWGYSTGVGQDKVLFTAIPFDVYYYEVISSPDSEQIGTTISINVPRQPGKYHQERNYFNAHNGDGYDVGATVLQHTIGNPFTYATSVERDTIKSETTDGLFSTSSLQVGQGNAYGTISLTTLTTDETWTAYDQNVTVAAEIGTQGIVAGASESFNYGYTYTTSVTTGTYIQGQVPDIDPNLYNSSMQFQWGLMAYPVVDTGQQFTLVTYWVDQ